MAVWIGTGILNVEGRDAGKSLYYSYNYFLKFYGTYWVLMSLKKYPVIFSDLSINLKESSSSLYRTLFVKTTVS